ncbi:aspartate racemase [marine bacterium AO1-C]|nr:aspartate racemase [marine bacterium AO1-C]
MKTIGMIGGMSWESSVVYYQLVNKKAKELLGGFHNCPNIMYTVDFAEIERLQREGNWKVMDTIMADAAKRLEHAGADIVVLCTNTMHLCSEAIRASISVPFLHIAEATAQAVAAEKLTKVALLGTRFTMEKDFYKDVLVKDYGIEVIIPNEAERNQIHDIIFDELVQGEIKDESRETYQDIIKRLENEGAQGVILGCTEIPLLIQPEDVTIPTFNTTKIHAEKAVEWALDIQAIKN